MTINICTIDLNDETGRQTIFWDTEDHLLHTNNPLPEDETDETEYRCETLEEAASTAWDLWKNGWGFEWVYYSAKSGYVDRWAGNGPCEQTLNAGEIGAICRGWKVDPVTVMDQLEEAPTVKYYVELIDTRYMIKDIETRDTVHTGLLADAGITEDPDPEYTNKLDVYFESEYGILPEEWEVG